MGEIRYVRKFHQTAKTRPQSIKDPLTFEGNMFLSMKPVRTRSAVKDQASVKWVISQPGG